MKKTFLVFSYLLALLPISYAYDFSAVAPSGQTLYYEIIGSTVRITCPCDTIFQYWYWGYTEPAGVLIIPSSVDNNGTSYSVTSIGAGAFGGCSNLTSVIIPSSVTFIANTSFSYCSGLSSIVIEAGNLQYDSRDNCNAIIETSTDKLVVGCKNTIIPNTIISIGGSAFYGCTGLISMTIPSSVTSIGGRAFCWCTGLASISIGNSVTSIGSGAFYGCSGLTEITCLATVAPTLDYSGNPFYGVPSTIPVNIPCGSQMSYYSRWSYFSNFIESDGYSFVAITSDSTKGKVDILVAPTCTAPTAAFNAVAYEGYTFSHWSDGNNENPRVLTVVSDTIVVAYFESTTQEVGSVDAQNVIIRSQDGQIVVENSNDNTVTLYDANGRILATKQDHGTTLSFDVLISGTYLVKIGNHPARKVVVIK